MRRKPLIQKGQIFFARAVTALRQARNCETKYLFIAQGGHGIGFCCAAGGNERCGDGGAE
jgi:hypothetical protein